VDSYALAVTVSLRTEDLGRALDDAYLLATGDQELPELWVERARRLGESPSVAFIAAVGAVLLAKAADPNIDAFVIQKKEGSAGAYSLRRSATALAGKRHAYAYDIGSSSDRDPINHGTLVSSKRWDIALDRIIKAHKPFFQVILTWLPDINQMDQEEATSALAAYIRVRREVAPGAAVGDIPATLDRPPRLTDLVEVLDAFVSADPEDGARGMALVAAAFRSAGFDADVPSRNDPRRIDIPIRRGKELVIGAEVKQLVTSDATADTLVRDVLDQGVRHALLAVLPPGRVDFDRRTVVRRAERDHDVMLRIVEGSRELLHEVLIGSVAPFDEFCSVLPRAFAEALRDIRVADESIETWAAISVRWTQQP